MTVQTSTHNKTYLHEINLEGFSSLIVCPTTFQCLSLPLDHQNKFHSPIKIKEEKNWDFTLLQLKNSRVKFQKERSPSSQKWTSEFLFKEINTEAKLPLSLRRIPEKEKHFNFPSSVQSSRILLAK